jgi:hypothetical protein
VSQDAISMPDGVVEDAGLKDLRSVKRRKRGIFFDHVKPLAHRHLDRISYAS